MENLETHISNDEPTLAFGVVWLVKMLTRIVILRHAETQLDMVTSASEWILSEEGVSSCKAMANSGVFSDIEAIYSSSEPKAIMTAEPFSNKLGLTVKSLSELKELDRGEIFLSNDGYLEAVRSSLSFPVKEVQGWEHPEIALQRFGNVISSISMSNYKRVLVVSHGLVISLFLALHLNAREDAFDRWKRLKFLSWGEIIGNTMLRDIV